MTLAAVALAVAVTDASADEPAALAPGQWTREQAGEWYKKQPWLVGCNFLPSSAVNDVEMWQKESFDPKTIDRELGWAQDLGFNTVRVFLNYVVWEADAAGLKKRFVEFLKVADRHGIAAMPILFDDCNFAGRDPAVGKQPDPVPGVANGQWVPSPPPAMVADRAAWPKLEQYVKDMVGTFAQDRRVVIWDLYNEPCNSGMGDRSLPLMEATFAWAREMKPCQPLTTGAWIDFDSPSSRRMMKLSDVVSFHGYDGVAGIEQKLQVCTARDRPVLCTEWLCRQAGNDFKSLFQTFRARRIGCWNWGLVAGRTQTYFHGGPPAGTPELALWQHDIFRADGSPYNKKEIGFIKVTTGKLDASALPQRKMLVPTAEKAPVPWRYVTEKPAADWFKPDFSDAAWQQGAAPFGTEELPVARKPNTQWTSADLWLRRTFEMPEGQFTDLSLLLHHDEDTEVYINGVVAVKAGGYNAAYEAFDITPEAQAALKAGKNVLAVHCHQTVGGQYLDLGIEGISSDAPAGQAATDDSTYRGWKSLALRNGLVELQVLPEIGGRIIQYKLGGKEFLWVNPQLAGKLPPATGLTIDGGWFNAGGDKLWPAPQGWDNEQQWPGPPDAVLDGQPYQLEQLSGASGQGAIRLTSGKDPRSGIRLSRVVRIFPNSTRVGFEATMENTDNKPRRWGIWAHTQLDGAKADHSAHNPLMQAWCPLNPRSRFPKGYDVIFGEKNNPSFQPDAARGLMHVNYQYKVGKIGLDSPAGWSATVDGESGAVFVQRFVFEPDKPYPDGSSVEFWLNGTGQIHAYGKDMVMAGNVAENPCVFESEVLSPFAELQPGQRYTWRYDWYACNIGGDFPVVDCLAAGVVTEPLSAESSAGKMRIKGRFGVFAPGMVVAEFADAQGRKEQASDPPFKVSPLKPLVLDATVKVPANATSVRLVLIGEDGKPVGDLGRASLAKTQVGPQ